MDDPREVEIMKRKVAEQLVVVTKLLIAKEHPDGIEHDIRIRKATRLFGDLYKSGPEGRELALDAVLTPDEREVAKQMKQKAPDEARPPALATPGRFAPSLTKAPTFGASVHTESLLTPSSWSRYPAVPTPPPREVLERRGLVAGPPSSRSPRGTNATSEAKLNRSTGTSLVRSTERSRSDLPYPSCDARLRCPLPSAFMT